MKKKLKKLAPWFILILPLFFIFRNWLRFSLIAAGDAPFYFQENLEELFLVPSLWFPQGLGSLRSLIFGHYFLDLPLKIISLFNLSWELTERILWYGPFLLLSLFSSWYFAKTVLPQGKIRFLTPFLYLGNTYILMIIGGGQISIALAYALFPLTLALLIKDLGRQNLKQQAIAGLALALQVAFDPRIAALAFILALIDAFLEFRLTILKYCKAFLLPLVIGLGLHFYWLLPLLILGRGSFAASYTAPGWVEFLSFADFSNSLALLHPNWPENIFGKTYFMRPEFLIIPILAFSAPLFLKGQRAQTKRSLIFLAGTALTGAFLAKGANPPLGQIYQGLFHYLPGMNLFRDATKFYVLIALAFSVLIPFSLEEISKRFKKIPYFKPGLLILFILYWLCLIRPAWQGQLTGTFQAKQTPQEYLVLKEFLQEEKAFFRTLWIPWRPKFGFYSHQHPAINSENLPPEEKLVSQGVKYVIIPFDSEGEIFLKDREYDPQQRQDLEEELDKTPWLKKVEVVDEIAVYQTQDYRDHFFLKEGEAFLEWKMIKPSQYKVNLETEDPVFLVFSETFDPLWQAKVGDKATRADNFNGLNSFSLDQINKREVMIEFTGEKYLVWGGIITLFTLLASLGALGYLQFKQG